MERKLGIGTAQFGFDYGISNRNGRTSSSEVAQVLAAAAQAGVRWLDTAPAYGVSETVLGETLWPSHRFRVTTKTPRLANPELGSGVHPAEHLRQAFDESLRKLRQEQIYGLLFHSSDDLLGPHGRKLFDAAMELKSKKRVDKVGVSIYTANEIDAVRERFAIDIVQLPLSIFDQRLLASGHVRSLHQEGVEIHARSVFLQGVVLMDPDELDARFDGVKRQLHRLREVTAGPPVALVATALGFVANLPEVSAVICGVNNVAQLSELLQEEIADTAGFDYSSFAVQDIAALDPRLWGSN